jgi:NADH-quinone oxidoreductase subunit M
MENKLWAGLAVIGVILAAAYLLWLYQRVFFGKVSNPKNEKLRDLNLREIVYFAPLIAIAFWIGLYPKPFFEILQQPVNQLVQTVRPGYPGANMEVRKGREQPAPVPAVTPATSTTPATTLAVREGGR